MGDHTQYTVVKYGCYLVKNSSLGIKDRKGNLMNGEHHVFVIEKSSDGERVKVKTITSLENISKDGKRRFHDGALDSVRKGEVIVIPQCLLNSQKLSGVNRRGIWVNVKDLSTKKTNYKFPIQFLKIICSDYKE